MTEVERADRVAVIVVAYGSDDVLPAFLGSVAVASRALLDVVVVDNRPEPGRVTAGLADAHGARYLPLPGNPGYGGAINAAARQLGTEPDWLLICNPDVVLESGSVDILLAAAQADDRIAAVGPRILDAEGRVYPSARSIPSLRTGAGHALLGRVWPTNPWTRRYRRDDTTTHPVAREAGWLSGACLLVRRTAFTAVSGFDESYFMYFEDVDLGYRLGRAGWRNRYEPAAIVRHEGGTSTAAVSEAMVRAHHRSAERFLRNRYPGAALAPIRLALGAGLRARAWLTLRGGGATEREINSGAERDGAEEP